MPPQCNPALEKRIDDSLIILQPLLPKNKKDSSSPYSNIEHKNGNGEGPFHVINMEYDEASFEQRPNIHDFVSAFIGFYIFVTGESQELTGTIRSGGVNVGLPETNPRVIAKLDTKQKKMSFGYRLDDYEAQIMISSYVKKIMRNH